MDVKQAKPLPSQDHEVCIWREDTCIPTERIINRFLRREEAVTLAEEAIREGALRAAVVDMTQRTRRGPGKTILDLRNGWTE